ncbi:MAG: hypothetical protein P8107_01900 [Spirochaetia bacterium]|jgi:hypothetical protein
MISDISSTGSAIVSRLYFMGDLTKKISVPVNRFLSPSVALKHLIGVPSSGSLEGIPLYKLRILDNLIERLTRLKKDGTSAGQADRVTAGNIDGMIKEIASQVKNAYGKLVPFAGGLSPEAGTLFNINV